MNMAKEINRLFKNLVGECNRILEEGDADASIMQVSRQIIKDHGITVVPEVSDELKGLSEHLKLHPGDLDGEDAATA